MKNIKQCLWDKAIEAVHWEATLKSDICLHTLINMKLINNLKVNHNKVAILLEFEKSQNTKVTNV